MSAKTKVILIALVVIAGLLFLTPVIKERKAYNEVKTCRNLSQCDVYLDKYPQGCHADDVTYMKTDISGGNWKYVLEYMEKYPKGKHINEVQNRYNQIWDEELERYQNRDKTNDDPNAVQYITEMLAYMKEHRVHTIQLDVNMTTNLKDYEDYSPQALKVVDMLYSESLPNLKEKMISLTSNFTTYDKEVLVKILQEGITSSFEKMFTPGFINVESNTGDTSNLPELAFKCNIANQEEEISSKDLSVLKSLFSDFKNIDLLTIPSIWTYTTYETHNNYYKTKKPVINGYLIGISVKFEAHFSIPGSETAFVYSGLGVPEEDIDNVQDIRDGYRQMTRICFARFSNKMSANMGLKETYFQDEE